MRGTRARVALLAVALLLAACSTAPKKPSSPAGMPAPGSGSATQHGAEIQDGGPAVAPDISHIREPEPRNEPLSRYGNRSPYTVLGRTYHVLPSASGYVERGIASWYGTKFQGRPTSSFEPYDMYQYTAAHKSLPLPSFARVTNLENGRSIVVRVNDRGPFKDDRIIDLSYVAAVKLGVHPKGTALVEVRALDVDAAEPGLPDTVLVSNPLQSWIQVGAFASEVNARRVQQRLQSARFDNVRIEVAGAGSALWRVRLGPYGDAVQAQAALDLLRGQGYGDARLWTAP